MDGRLTADTAHPAPPRLTRSLPPAARPPYICIARSYSVSSGSSRCTRLPVLSASCSMW